MAVSIVLTNLASLENDATAIATINANNDAIATAFEDAISLDGTAPNEMHAQLDMNSNRIINLPDPISNTEPVTRGYADANYGYTDGTVTTDASVPVLANIAALRAYNIAAPTTIDIVGYYSPTTTSAPDGGGGRFIHVTSDTTSSDNNGTIIVDVLERRWYRQCPNETVNVMWFGATGTYAFVYSGTTAGAYNTLAFQSALNYCASAGIRDFYVPGGGYLIDSSLTQTSLVNWRGDGKQVYSSGCLGGTTLSWFNTTYLAGLVINVPNNAAAGSMSIRDIEFWKNNASDTALHHAILFKSGQVFLAGTIERCQFTNWSGYALYWQVDSNGLTPAFQNMNLQDISASRIGGFMGVDDYLGAPYGGETCNLFRLSNFNLENSVDTRAGLMPAFFCTSTTLALYENINLEGGGSCTPIVFRLGSNGYIDINGLYLEIGSPGGPIVNIIENVVGRAATSIEVRNVSIQGSANCPSNAFIKFNSANGMDGSTHVTLDKVTGLSTLAQIADFSESDNHFVDFKDSGFAYQTALDDDMIYRKRFENLEYAAGIYGAEGQLGTYNFTISQKDNEFFTKRGWLDGVSGGPLITSTSNVTSIGIVDDADEGRVFELVGTTNLVPEFTFNFTPLTTMVNNQLVLAMRYKVISSQTGLSIWPMFPNDTLNPMIATSYTGKGFTPALNTWQTGFFVGRPFTNAPTTIDSRYSTGGASPYGYTTKIRIAAIYAGLGRDMPYLVGGAAPGKALTWSATAVPTYGNYYVGDTVINSVPTIGQPEAWVCTAAGSPGTWVSTGSFLGTATTYATAAPTTGAHVVGDQVINSVPTVGQPKGWVCTVAGTPGTWVSTGNLLGTSTSYATAAPTTGAHLVGDIVINSTPTIGQPISWVCTSAGTPGTWISEGNLLGTSITYATTAPTSGAHAVGDKVVNSTPTIGQPISWICTAAGSPGTWVSEGNLVGVITTYATAAPTTGTHNIGDMVINSVPTVGQPKSWVCTVTGTPGTWVSTGNL